MSAVDDAPTPGATLSATFVYQHRPRRDEDWAEDNFNGGRTSFRAEIYEWQVAARLVTAKVADAAKERIAAALSDAPAAIDFRRVGRLEQELRTIALDNAFGRIGDADYLRRKTDLTTEIEAARRPQRSAGPIDPTRAFT